MKCYFLTFNERIKLEKAFLISAIMNDNRKYNSKEDIDELKALASTAGAITVGQAFQNRKKQDPATFIGKGKAHTIFRQAEELGCGLIIFNNEISPTQIKNLQKLAGDKIKVIDRTGLILDIFIKHAKTHEAKTQVELAQLEYLLPRLTRQWTHLERQMGGIGTRAGSGESQIEIDRRLLRKHISKLKSTLKQIQSQRNIQSHGRKGAYRIALVGYTNTGKSTLMQRLSSAEVFIQNKLFATLDTTTRKLDLGLGIPILLSDTVGFIRNLPHHLVASFRSTLSEIKEVDLLLQIYDASSNNLQIQIDTVDEVLFNLNIKNKITLKIFNKIDRISDFSQLKGLKKRYNEGIFISALDNLGLDVMHKNICNIIKSNFLQEIFHLNYKQTKIIDTIYALTHVLNKKDNYDGIILKVEGNKEALEKIRRIIEN